MLAMTKGPHLKLGQVLITIVTIKTDTTKTLSVDDDCNDGMPTTVAHFCILDKLALLENPDRLRPFQQLTFKFILVKWHD